MFNMENTLNEYLPEYILDGLTLRVINKLGNFCQDCMPKNNADVIKACRTIEQNVQLVYSVITNAKRNMNTYLNGYGYRYRHFLTSVYVLLYYRHCNDEPYQIVVFPQLKLEMGDFANKTIIKEVVDKMLEEDAKLRSMQEKKSSSSILQMELASGTENPIELADKRGSDFVRAVQAMCLCGYFEHKDKTFVTPTEVGSMLVKLFGRNTEWKSLLQKAYGRDNPLKTFDELRDKAQEYWQKRAGIKDN